MMSPVKLREATFEDHAAISALESAQGLHPKSLADWRRLWIENPCYRQLSPDWPIGWVLESDDGRIVGSLGNVPLPYVLDGQPLVVAAGRAWVVEEKFRGFALWLMDRYFRQKRPDIFINTTVNAKAGEAFAAFGSARVPVGDWFQAAYFITRHRVFAESALRIKRAPQPRLLRYPVGFGLGLKDLLGSQLPPVPAGIEVELHRAFDERFDSFWPALLSNRKALMAVRTREVLQWHFASCIDRNELWVVTAHKRKAMQAYGVFQRRDEPRFGLKRMRLIDFQSLDAAPCYCLAILRHALDRCRAEGIAVLEHVGCGLKPTEPLERYAPYRRKLASWPFYYRARTKALEERLAAPEAWSPSSFDGDASL